MTLQEFQKTITKADWYGKYLWYLFSFGLIGASIYSFFDLTKNPEKYNLRHTYTLAFFVGSFFFVLGCCALYLLPNRYKVLTIDNNFSIDTKKQIISKLFDKLHVQYFNNQETFYSFTYQRKWWTKDYKVYLNIDSEKIYLSVLLRTSYLRGGFIDFGGSEKLRNKIISIIKLLIADE